MSEHTLYTLWLALAGKLGSRRNATLLRSMTPHDAYHATKAELLAFLDEKDAVFFLNKDLKKAKEIYFQCEEKGIRTVCFHDPDYPPALREIEDPPAVLFYYGKFPKANLPTMGIVGTRACSRTAAGIAASFACSLASSGFQIVSGMANGIDTYAHKGPLYKGIHSFAVLGCGVDVIYPKQNETLYHILKERGGLISEYPPGTPPIASNFPRRNRIISGLSDGVLVVECPPKSGSMSTARYAVEQNRTLFAVPAAPDEKINTGTNRLIKHGAVFCTEPADIFREFESRFGDKIVPTEIYLQPVSKDADKPEAPLPPAKPNPPEKKKTTHRPPPLSEEETRVYKAFGEGEELSADQICQRTGLPFFRILPLLQAMELTGCIDALPGSLFRKK